VTVTLFVECQPDDNAVYIFPFTGEDMAVTGLRRHQWRNGIHGHSPMNRRLCASCCEQCAGEKDGDIDVSQEHVGLSTRTASSYLPFGERSDKQKA
jgi:hypothetical protein